MPAVGPSGVQSSTGVGPVGTVLQLVATKLLAGIAGACVQLITALGPVTALVHVVVV